MKYLLILLFLFSFSSAWALPECEGSPYKVDDSGKKNYSLNWDNCKGTYILANGDKYVGGFKKGNLDGVGTTIQGGNKIRGKLKYTGEWKEGERHGQGSLVEYRTNAGVVPFQVYKGTYVKGKKEGYGIEIMYDRNHKILHKYIGFFKNDLKHGDGRHETPIFYVEGAFENGAFRKGKLETNGKEVLARGEFVCISFACFRKGTLTIFNGGKSTTYKGTFKDTKRHGYVVSKKSDGEEVHANYIMGKQHGEVYIKYASGKEVYYEANNDVIIEGTLTSVPNAEMQKLANEIITLQKKIIQLDEEEREFNRRQAKSKFLLDLGDRLLQKGEYANKPIKETIPKMNNHNCYFDSTSLIGNQPLRLNCFNM
tara:strand:- start:302 stop:1405 length:1104 start_codon:yes stop_codon:yes gene_type:complete